MRSFAAATAIIALASGPALAGNAGPAPVDPVVTMPSAPVMMGHDWSGGYVGAQLGYGKVDADTVPSVDGSGAIGGLHAGYNYDFGNYVLGGEIDYNAADIALTGGAGNIDSVARLKLKGGYDFGKTLFYATGGAAYADGDLAGVSANDTGYFAGVGLEYMISDRMSLGGEALYHRFNNFDGSGVDVDATTVQAKVSFHF